MLDNDIVSQNQSLIINYSGKTHFFKYLNQFETDRMLEEHSLSRNLNNLTAVILTIVKK